MTFYKQTGPNYFPQTNYYDPTDTENIEVYGVSEGYFKDGAFLPIDDFFDGNEFIGRTLTHNNDFMIGFMGYEINPKRPDIYGPGFKIDTSEHPAQIEEEIFNADKEENKRDHDHNYVL